MPVPLTKEELTALLAAALPGADIAVRDDSARHAGHAGNGGGGHYTVAATWTGFENLGRLARQRLVHAALDGPLKAGRIHALALSLHTPGEVA